MTVPKSAAAQAFVPRRGQGQGPATTSAVGTTNQNAIVEAVRANGEISKARIAEITGLSDPTVNRLLKTLIDQGYIEHAGVEASSGGRPPVTVRVVPLAVLTGAVRAHAGRVLGALVGFNGAIIERFEYEVPFDGPESGPDTLRAMLTTLIQHAERRGAELRGIGVSWAGIIDNVRPIPGLDRERWSEVTAAHLSRGFTVPIIIENDANVLAIGELYRGVGREARDFVTLVLDRGLGAGVVVNGALYRGARSAAGEVGYLLLGADSLTRGLQDRGELEAVLEPATVTRNAHAVGIDFGRELTAPEVIALAAEGNVAASALAGEVLDGLARGIAALSSILDPQVILLGEGLDMWADVVIPAILKRLDGKVQFLPELGAATLGADAVLLGAAEMALRASGGLLRPNNRATAS